jgi:hypothetical protein
LISKIDASTVNLVQHTEAVNAITKSASAPLDTAQSESNAEAGISDGNSVPSKYRDQLIVRVAEEDIICDAPDENVRRKGDNLDCDEKNTGQMAVKPYIIYCDFCHTSPYLDDKTPFGIFWHRDVLAEFYTLPAHCEICGRQNMQASREILELKPQGRGVSCALCGDQFNCMPRLMKHAVRHTGKMPFRCDICNAKTYKNIENFVKHQRSCQGGL